MGFKKISTKMETSTTVEKAKKAGQRKAPELKFMGPLQAGEQEPGEQELHADPCPPCLDEEAVEELMQAAGSKEELQAELDKLQLMLQVRQLKSQLVKKMSVHEAIIYVREQVGRVAKAGENKSQGYTYTMAADVIAECRDAMNKAGLVVHPTGVINQRMGGKSEQIIFGAQLFRVYGPDGSSIEVPIEAAGQDYGDKGPYKFNTGALKYLMINLFLIPQGLDPEKDEAATPPPATQYSSRNGVATKNEQPQGRQPVPKNEVTEAANVQKEEPGVNIKYASAKQKEEIISLLNNPTITRQEKTKMLLNINRFDEDRAQQAIEKLKIVIEEREDGQSAAN